MITDVLTPRQREVAYLLAQGVSNKEITEKLVVDAATVDAHIVHIRGRLGAKSSRQLVVMLARALEDVRAVRPEAG